MAELNNPLRLGMFRPQIEGDHHLMELAQRRYSEAKIGAEFYPTSLEDLQASLEFRPLTERRYTLHLPRHLRLTERQGINTIMAFAERARSDAYGLIIHDQWEMATKPQEYVQAIRGINNALLKLEPSPYLFIEYAVGLEVSNYVAVFEAVQECERVSACLDIGHIGIRKAQLLYGQLHPGVDVCQLKPTTPKLPAMMQDVVTVTAMALPTVLQVIQGIGRLDKPLHFHLHDGHPLSTFSIYGVCDHLSFYHEIHLPFAHNGQFTVPLMYGPAGLREIIRTALRVLPSKKLSFMLEIQPQDQHLELGRYAELFKNWQDKRNAEQMNAWLETVLLNLRLLNEECGPAGGTMFDSKGMQNSLGL